MAKIYRGIPKVFFIGFLIELYLLNPHQSSYRIAEQSSSCCDKAYPCREFRYKSIYSVSTSVPLMRYQPTVPIDS